ncbi:MAG: adventurous gliding motility protein GltJ [Archangium sp.]
MRFVCESCRAQYMINDEKVGPKGVKVRCRKCGYVILVKRADAGKNGPVAMSNDPDDALATQVMQTPLAPAEATLSNEDTQATEMTNPGTNTTSPTLPGVADAKAGGAEGGPKDSFFGADEDEIGAVFDQVLKTGGAPGAKEGENGAAAGDDRQSTRVIDAETVRKLAEESGVVEKAAAPEPKAEEIPQTDWYVAINEKQTGPLTLDKIKDHWDKGEISPDSLCWRAGFDDWIPVSEVKMLTSVLAPKPPKPIVVAPAATITHSNAPALVSMPVQSAFSAGGMVQTVQSEVQVPMSAVAASGIADREESGSWKPSAGLALASLVKDEMEAQTKPPPPKAPPPPDEPMGKGLLDLPSHSMEEKATNSAVVVPVPVESRVPRSSSSQPPVNPYLANPGATYSAPAVTQYRPPSNRNLMIGIAAGGGLLLVILISLVVWLAVRNPPPPVYIPPPNPPVAVNNPPQNPVVNPPPTNPNPTNVAPTNPNPNPTNPANPNVAPTNPTAPVNPPANVANPANPPNPNPNPTVAANPPAPNNVAPSNPVMPKNTNNSGGNKTNNNSSRQPKETKQNDPPAEPKETKKSPKEEDDFDSAFGTPKAAPKEETAKTEKKQPGYIPPPPGGAEAKEKLEQGDIMEGVLGKKGDLAACTAKKEAGTSGKIVMEWSISPAGKVTKVGVAAGSEDFKGTPMAACFSTVIKGMTFPKSKTGSSEPVKFPFKF